MYYNEGRRGRGRGDGGYDGGRGVGGRGGGGFRGGGRGGGGGPQGFRLPGPISPINAIVKKVEDSLIPVQSSQNLVNLSFKESLPRRPAFGTQGKQISVIANYFEIAPRHSLVLYRYDVQVKPHVVGRKLTQIIRLLLEESAEFNDARGDVASDFGSTIISRVKIKGLETPIDISIDYKAEGEDTAKTGATTYTATVQYTNTLSLRSLLEYMTSTDLSARCDDSRPLIQALNILLNHYSKSTGSLATIGCSKRFSMAQGAESFTLGNGLMAFRGFFSSVRLATARVLVNVNVSHGAFYLDGPLLGLYLEYGAYRGMHKLSAFLKRIKVRPTHLKDRTNSSGRVIPRVKRIFGLAMVDDGCSLEHPPKVAHYGAGAADVVFWRVDDTASSPAAAKSTRPAVPGASVLSAVPGAPAPKMKGKGRKGGNGGKATELTAAPGYGGGRRGDSGSGKYITVAAFFEEHYKIRVDTKYPVVNVGNRENPSYLPPEVCHVIPGQACKTKLDPPQTQSMIKFAVRGPGENAESITKNGFETVGLTPKNALLDSFGISVPSTQMVTVNARVLPEPKIMYQGSTRDVSGGSWNMVGVKFLAKGRLTSWSCIVLDMPNSRHRASPGEVKELVGDFHRALGVNGVEVCKPAAPREITVKHPDDPQLDLIIRQAANATLSLLLVLLPEAGPVYKRIKYLGDVKYGVRTICAVTSKISKPQGQPMYFANVALKFNLKAGGINQMVDTSRLALVNEGKTMIVGLDVTHPSPDSSTKAPSVAGMVASVNSSLGQWPAVIRIQRVSAQEMVSDICDMLKSRFATWRTVGGNKSLPENILVYRDGVSEGQYSQVVDIELPELRRACKETYPADLQKQGLPRISIIIVGKRHHTRFYPTIEGEADRGGNTKAGTVVDRGITEARTWDFFLQAHAAIKGTARPAHYIVVLDEIFRHIYAKAQSLPPGCSNVADVLEKLTQGLSYVYGRATKAVSICTPAYYADLVCERARCYLTDMFDESPTASTAPSVVGSQISGPSNLSTMAGMVKVHDRVKDTMFYI